MGVEENFLDVAYNRFFNPTEYDEQFAYSLVDGRPNVIKSLYTDAGKGNIVRHVLLFFVFMYFCFCFNIKYRVASHGEGRYRYTTDHPTNKLQQCCMLKHSPPVSFLSSPSPFFRLPPTSPPLSFSPPSHICRARQPLLQNELIRTTWT